MIVDLMRHAATGREGYLDGRKPAGLVPGALDALCRGQCGIGWSAVVASSWPAAEHSARALVAGPGLECEIDADWREADFGDWDGMPLDVLDPAELAGFFDAPHALPPPGGETWGDYSARLEAALLRALARAEALDGPLLVVTQAGPIRWAIARLTGMPLESLWALRVGEGCRVRLDVRRSAEGQWWGELIELRPLPAAAPLPTL